MLNNIKKYSLKTLKYLLIFSFILVFFMAAMPYFASFFEGWKNISLYILYIKYFVMILLFLYWNQICIFFISNEEKLEQLTKARNKVFVIVLFIELTTWFSRGIL